MTQALVVTLVALLAVIPVLWVLLVRARMKREAERMVEEFQRNFPGQCLICSYHRYGVMGGHVSGKVEVHDCIEQSDSHEEVG